MTSPDVVEREARRVVDDVHVAAGVTRNNRVGQVGALSVAAATAAEARVRLGGVADAGEERRHAPLLAAGI